MEQKQADELKYWTAVRENPADFNSWTFLLQTVDQQVWTISRILC